MLKTELLIIGGGAAGMAAALAATGQTVLLVERDSRLGGVLPQCLHHGFGLSYFHQDLTGAEYARRFVEQINNSPVQVPVSYTHLDVYKRQMMLCFKRDKHLSEAGRQFKEHVIEYLGLE